MEMTKIKGNSFDFKTSLVAIISAVAMLFSVAAHAVCFPGDYPGTVNAGNIVSGGRACFPATGTYPAGCAILTFPTTTAPGPFTKTVETFPGADYFCSDGTQRGLFVAFTGTLGTSGYVGLKYQVVGLAYAPPGAKSSVAYADGYLNGTSTSITQAFTAGVSVTGTLAGGGDLFGILQAGSTETNTIGFSQEEDTTNTISIVEQDSTGESVPGPLASNAGVDHDYDIIYVWLNPDVSLTVFPPSTVDFNGYAWDPADTITGPDIVFLTVGQLKGTQTIESSLLARLARTWDSSLGGLTAADYAAIANADPFVANPSFNPNTDTSGRFEFPQVNGQPQDLIVNYIPAATGGQPITNTYTSNYTSTSVSGQGSKETFTVAAAVTGSVSASFFASVYSKLAATTTFTYTNQWSHTVTAGASQSANFTIVGPLSTDGYTGPTAMQVWKDNIYGSFMFYPEN
jgi:hypothetical protein